MKLSKNFYLSEFTLSQTAARHNIDMTVSDEVEKNLRLLCDKILQPIRDSLGPVYVSSGFRPKELNTLIGGSKTSQHVLGQAADFSVSGLAPLVVCQWVDEHLIYDQLIHEFGSWIHVSFKDNPRNQSLTAFKRNGDTVYKPGLLDMSEVNQ